MAAFYIAPHVTNHTLRQLLGPDLSQTYRRDRAVFWWNAFALAGLEKEWEWFVAARNSGTERLSTILVRLRARVKEEDYKLLFRRLGYSSPPPLSSQFKNYPRTKGTVWTKGGTWHRVSNMTRLLVDKQPLGPRPITRPFQARLGQSGIEQVERELMSLIDPNEMLIGDARTQAMEYVRDRIPQLLGQRYRMDVWWLPWFFMQHIIYQGNRYRLGRTRKADSRLLRGGEKRRWD